MRAAARASATIADIFLTEIRDFRQTVEGSTGVRSDDTWSNGFGIVHSTDRQVEAWSYRRLPYEPRGDALEFRGALRAHIARVEPRGLLRCVYASADRTFCDTENVLLYNVGMSTFARLLARGLVFERAFEVPPAPTSGSFVHHHAYSTSQRESPGYWSTPRALSTWRTRAPEKRTTAAPWWLAVSKARVRDDDRGLAAQTPVTGDLGGVPFGLRIRVAPGAVPIHSALKPMLDGTIAALHSDSTALPLSVSRLSQQIGHSEADVRAILGTAGPLGVRPGLVRPYRSGLQWNPADALCVACSVVTDPSLQSNTVEGELLEVVPSTVQTAPRLADL